MLYSHAQKTNDVETLTTMDQALAANDMDALDRLAAERTTSTGPDTRIHLQQVESHLARARLHNQSREAVNVALAQKMKELVSRHHGDYYQAESSPDYRRLISLAHEAKQGTPADHQRIMDKLKEI